MLSGKVTLNCALPSLSVYNFGSQKPTSEKLRRSPFSCINSSYSLCSASSEVFASSSGSSSSGGTTSAPLLVVVVKRPLTEPARVDRTLVPYPVTTTSSSAKLSSFIITINSVLGLTSTSFVCIPIKLNSSVLLPPRSHINSKYPSMSVTAPFPVPFSTIETPVNGSSSPSIYT